MRPLRVAFSTALLHEQVYDFLRSDRVQKTVNKILKAETTTQELYLSLRRDKVKWNKRGNYSRLVFDPDKKFNKLWLHTRKAFKRPSDDEAFETVWPAGDYATWGELYKKDRDATWIYDELSEGKENPFVSDRTEQAEPKDQLAFASSIYLCFVIPYAMARYSLQQRPTPPPPGCFNFVYRGGGAGALVGPVAYTCAHTVSYELKYAYADYREDAAQRHVVMLHDGRLAILGNWQIASMGDINYDSNKDLIDAAMGEVVEWQGDDDLVTMPMAAPPLPSGRGRRAIRPEVICIGAPSVIDTGEGSGSVIGPYADRCATPCADGSASDCYVDLQPNRRRCIWDPAFFHAQRGKIDKVFADSLDHTALLWSGMSGGPIYELGGPVVGIHHSANGGAMRIDRLHDVIEWASVNLDNVINE